MNVFEKHANDEVVALVGDVHGNGAWLREKIEEMASNGVSLMLHLGDFGIWPGNHGAKFLHTVSKACKEFDVDILVTLGNHEDYSRINERWKNSKRQDEDGNPIPQEISERVWLLPRPWRFDLSGVSFLSFGGAASVDFEWRSEGSSWWPEEMPTRAEADKAIASGYADVMLVHETVDFDYAVHSVQKILLGNPIGFSKEGLEYSAKSRELVTEIFEAVKPRLLAHGHMHSYGVRRNRLDGADYDSIVLSTTEEYTDYNLFYLNLKNFTNVFDSFSNDFKSIEA